MLTCEQFVRHTLLTAGHQWVWKFTEKHTIITKHTIKFIKLYNIIEGKHVLSKLDRRWQYMYMQLMYMHVLMWCYFNWNTILIYLTGLKNSQFLSEHTKQLWQTRLNTIHMYCSLHPSPSSFLTMDEPSCSLLFLLHWVFEWYTSLLPLAITLLCKNPP